MIATKKKEKTKKFKVFCYKSTFLSNEKKESRILINPVETSDKEECGIFFSKKCKRKKQSKRNYEYWR